MITVHSRAVGALTATLAAAALSGPLPDALAAANGTRNRSHAAARTPRHVPRVTTRSSACPAFLRGHCPPSIFGHLRSRTSAGEHDDRGGRGDD